jgi:glycosyltransferase involved in cell wall biosynthesis
MAPTAVQLSFRLGGTDGVAVEARKWEWALRELGFTVRRVAGELDDGFRPDDTWLPFLAIDPVPGARAAPDALAAALAGADLVLVENLCSLPLNPEASTVAARVLDHHAGPVVFHHHDLPWQRPGMTAPPGIPPIRDNAVHVTINDFSRAELAAHGIPSLTIRNAFDFDAVHGDRDATRRAFDFSPDDVVVLQPTRAIPRKNVPAAIHFAQALERVLAGPPVRLWITGPAEDGYDDDLARLVANARVPVTVGRASTAADAYAAADIVVFPSTWEGFGNPVAESIAYRRPLVVGGYPALDELVLLGLELLPLDRPDLAAAWLRDPDLATLEANVERLRRQCSLADLPCRLARALETLAPSR